MGGRSYINARRPGLQALFERFLKGVGYSMLVDEFIPGYCGNGCLDNGSMISPEQFLLDLEAQQGMDWLWAAPAVPPPGDAADRIRDAVLSGRGNFLETEHTLAHYRDEVWDALYFRCRMDTLKEKEILDQCHAEYRAKVAAYEPASYPEDTLRAMESILARARKELVK